jgi:hypothetical protein
MRCPCSAKRRISHFEFLLRRRFIRPTFRIDYLHPFALPSFFGINFGGIFRTEQIKTRAVLRLLALRENSGVSRRPPRQISDFRSNPIAR